MRRGFGLFWILFMLFYAIPFPMLLYYNIKSEDPPELGSTSPWVALGLLAVSVVLWLLLLAGYFKKWVLSNFIAKRNIERLKAHGIRRLAEIRSAVKISKDGSRYDTYELRLAFKNLADSEIIQKTVVNDARPSERRFEAGKRVEVLIDREIKHVPYFTFASSEATIRPLGILLVFLGWIAVVVLVVGYYVYSYQTENIGMGWRFMAFWHPLIICPAVLLFYRGLLRLIFNRIGGKSLDEAVLIKYKGIRTTARLISASQTGTYINEQPMVRFQLEFTDHLKRTRRAEIKKIVDLLDLNSVKQETAGIFYLKDHPDRIAFEADLEEIS